MSQNFLFAQYETNSENVVERILVSFRVYSGVIPEYICRLL